MKRIIFSITLLVLTAQQTQAAVDPAATVQKLTADDGAEYDHFGRSVSLSADGSIALIGSYAYGPFDQGSNFGAAYVFIRATDGSWIQHAKLTANDGAADDSFGNSVSLSADGGIALIGAYRDDNDKGWNAGAAYVFIRAADGGWSLQAKLTADDGAWGDQLGASVSLSADGDVALISTFYDDDKGNNSGSAYVFTRAADGNWSGQDKLIADDGAADDIFGHSVSLSADGNSVLIGASNDDDKGNDSGSAYVFTRAADGGWSWQAKLTADDGAAGDHFGTSVSLSADGNCTLIGAYGDADTGDFSGSAYIFTHVADEGWSQQAKLTADDGAAGDHFGASVSLSADGNSAIVGASGDDGSAYIFTRVADGGWSHQAKLIADDGEAGDHFGSSALSADGGIALIGASGDDDKGGDSGSAYVFDLHNVFNRSVCGWVRNLPANTWLMTAPSCQPDPTDISSQYSELGTYATNWIGWKWDANAQNYPPAMAATDPLVLGDGNWVYSKTAGRLNLSGTATSTTDCAAYGGSGQCFAIDLAIPLAGVNFWNMVGHPFPYAVNWADVQVAVSSDGGAKWGTYSPSTAEIAGYVSKIYYRWNGNAYESYDDSTPGSLGVLQPQESVWVRSLGSYSGPVPQKLKLLIPVR